jgi:hypothetical protein
MSDTEHPGQRIFADVRQAATEAAGNLGADLSQRARDEVVIVEKPLGGFLVSGVLWPRRPEASRRARDRPRHAAEVEQRYRARSREAQWAVRGGERRRVFIEAHSASSGRTLWLARTRCPEAWPA